MRIIRYTSPLARNVYPVFAQSPWPGLEAQMDRLFEAAAASETIAPSVSHFPLDLYEDASATYLRAELPGVNRADIGVEVLDGSLQITAKRTVKTGDREKTTEYSRNITLPAGTLQAEHVAAVYDNGILTVTLPKREETRPRKINVAIA